MWTDRVQLLRDASGAGWIGERLAPSWESIAGSVPSGFEAYVRVLHPVDTGEGYRSWAQVGAVTGRRVHPTAQWHSLIGAPSPDRQGSELWDDGEPEQGNLPLEALLALCDVLARHTATPQDCYFAVWEGWGELHGSGARWGSDDGWSPLPALLSPEELATPRLQLPGRDYYLFRGPLSAMRHLAHVDDPDVWWSQSPALFWPADRSWFMVTEVDFDSTIVAASASAAHEVIGSPDLEALTIGHNDSPQFDADEVNAPSPPGGTAVPPPQG